MKRALCLMKASTAERLPNTWFSTMKKMAPTRSFTTVEGLNVFLSCLKYSSPTSRAKMMVVTTYRK